MELRNAIGVITLVLLQMSLANAGPGELEMNRFRIGMTAAEVQEFSPLVSRAMSNDGAIDLPHQKMTVRVKNGRIVGLDGPHIEYGSRSVEKTMSLSEIRSILGTPDVVSSRGETYRFEQEVLSVDKAPNERRFHLSTTKSPR